MKTKKAILTAVLVLPLLNSCYFNSAGHIFEKASRSEAISTRLVTGGDYVYFDGVCYYIELPRYKTGKSVKTQYDLPPWTPGPYGGGKEQFVRVAGETMPVRITREFAMFLTGQDDGLYKPTPNDILWVMQDKELDKNSCQVFTVTRKPGDLRKGYRYTSPYAFGWYSLGVLDWLCVDVPMTCLENSLLISTYAAFGWAIIPSCLAEQQQAQYAFTPSTVPASISRKKTTQPKREKNASSTHIDKDKDKDKDKKSPSLPPPPPPI